MVKTMEKELEGEIPPMPAPLENKSFHTEQREISLQSMSSGTFLW